MFCDREIALLRAIIPHLQRAGRIGIEWAKAKAAGMAEAFEQMGSGAILLDYHGRVVRVSPSVEEHIGSAIMIVQRLLLATDKAANAELQRLIGAVIGAGTDVARVSVALPRKLGRPLIAYASPVLGDAGEIFRAAKGVIVLTDPDRRLPILDMSLRQAFHLSQAEIKLAKQLALGVDIAEASRILGIQTGTARTCLKSIFAKTGTHRQAELAVLLNRLGRSPGRLP
jgi:DNA-binding CsgD family transcriptional regulator